MDFLWKNKAIVVLALVVGGYFVANPAGRFGFTAPGLVIYDRVPIPFFDIYIAPDGQRMLFENLSKPEDFAALCDSLRTLEPFYERKPVTLLVGEGFGARPQISMLNEKRCTTIPYTLKVKQLPSRRAIQSYNQLRSKGLPVAIVLKVKRT